MVYITHNLELKKIIINEVPMLYYEVELPCAIVGTVVDIETTSIKPSDGYITALGIVKWNKLSCFVIDGGAMEIVDIMDSDDKDDIIKKHEIIAKYNRFADWCKKKVSSTPIPRAAYNKQFEHMWLNEEFIIEIQPIPFQKKDAGYHNNYSKKYMNAAIVIDHIGKSINNKEMIYASAHKIMKHLIQDMYAELALYVTKANMVRQRKEGFLPYELRDI